MQSTVFIDIPEDFSFKATVNSHGWRELAPFEFDEENWRLSYVFRDEKHGAVPVVISEEKEKIRIDVAVPDVDVDRIARDARHLLRLDDDLNGFYESIIGHERLTWVGEQRAGRLLRSPTVFEDLVKTICTTNCSWALTKIMVSNLVEKLGGTRTLLPASIAVRPAKRAGVPALHPKTFPTAEAMAAMDEDFYRTEIRAGYRSPYFVELAESVASGRLDPQAWLTSDLPTTELKKEMKKVKGVGDYAAENLLKLVGRYDGLALDSWLRSQFYKNHNNEKKCADKKIEKHYKKFGQWRGLVIWCDMTEKWFTRSEPPA
jgi:3-methyladenine DNA glycosylase/8-oxoguanine DNA glycosylase